jgi:hypothetical protein
MNHAHVVQGIEIYRNRTLCYALGNFVFGGNASIRTESFRDRTVTSLYSLVVQAQLVFSDSGKYLGQTLTLYPSYSSEANPEGIVLRKRIYAMPSIASHKPCSMNKKRNRNGEERWT